MNTFATMTYDQLRESLTGRERLDIRLPDGSAVPGHFHVTEVAHVTKRFVDCGGVRRERATASLQLWSADDYDHRLHPEKLAHILAKGAELYGLGSEEVEVEYQGDTIRVFGLEARPDCYELTSTATTCLARDACAPRGGALATVAQASDGCCSPASGCC